MHRRAATSLPGRQIIRQLLAIIIHPTHWSQRKSENSGPSAHFVRVVTGGSVCTWHSITATHQTRGWPPRPGVSKQRKRSETNANVQKKELLLL